MRKPSFLDDEIIGEAADMLLNSAEVRRATRKRGLSVMADRKEITLFSDCMNRVTNLADTIDLFEEIDIE